jgi:hypothetical protein
MHFLSFYFLTRTKLLIHILLYPSNSQTSERHMSFQVQMLLHVPPPVHTACAACAVFVILTLRLSTLWRFLNSGQAWAPVCNVCGEGGQMGYGRGMEKPRATGGEDCYISQGSRRLFTDIGLGLTER